MGDGYKGVYYTVKWAYHWLHWRRLGTCTSWQTYAVKLFHWRKNATKKLAPWHFPGPLETNLRPQGKGRSPKPWAHGKHAQRWDIAWNHRPHFSLSVIVWSQGMLGSNWNSDFFPFLTRFCLNIKINSGGFLWLFQCLGILENLTGLSRAYKRLSDLFALHIWEYGSHTFTLRDKTLQCMVPYSHMSTFGINISPCNVRTTALSFEALRAAMYFQYLFHEKANSETIQTATWKWTILHGYSVLE